MFNFTALYVENNHNDMHIIILKHPSINPTLLFYKIKRNELINT